MPQQFLPILCGGSRGRLGGSGRMPGSLYMVYRYSTVPILSGRSRASSGGDLRGARLFLNCFKIIHNLYVFVANSWNLDHHWSLGKKSGCAPVHCPSYLYILHSVSHVCYWPRILGLTQNTHLLNARLQPSLVIWSRSMIFLSCSSTPPLNQYKM